MALIVQKFGGTSVGSTEKIKAVARRVMAYQQQGNQMVVVLSAMSGETDRLTGFAHNIQAIPRLIGKWICYCPPANRSQLPSLPWL